MKDAKGHGSDPRNRMPTIEEASRPGIRSPAGAGKPMASDNIDTMRIIADLRARMSGTGPGHQAALGQGIRNLQGVSFDRGGGRLK